MAKIKTATEADLPYLLPMALELWPDDTAEEMIDILTAVIRSAKFRILIAGDITEVQGFIYLGLRTDYVEGADSSPTGYIEGVYVKPEYRKSGISRRLLAAGEEWLREQGCTQIGSDISLDNRASYNFHIHTGFKEAARLIAFIKDL